ncbi:shikimate kinase [bacterium]|nr:shikimate kinase [bacterium]
MKDNIILIGMMGSGKTTVARELAANLKSFKLVDIDEEIEKSTGKKISEIFLKFGEKHFRLLEEDKIRQVCEKYSQIIALGGGAFETPDNRNLLLNSGKVIYLKASAREIFERIKLETHRPLLKKNFSIERINSLIEAREINYKKAHIQIDTNGKTPYNIVEEILGVLNG